MKKYEIGYERNGVQVYKYYDGHYFDLKELNYVRDVERDTVIWDTRNPNIIDFIYED